MAIKRQKSCPLMLASGFMNAKAAEHCLNLRQVIVVFSVLMALFRVHRFNKVQDLVVHRR